MERVLAKPTWGRHAETWPLKRAPCRARPTEVATSRRAVSRGGAYAGEVNAGPPRKGMAFEAGGASRPSPRGCGLEAGDKWRQSLHGRSPRGAVEPRYGLRGERHVGATPLRLWPQGGR